MKPEESPNSSMDHEEAVRTLAVERYFLRAMSEQDAEAFEAHFFVCIWCAADVAATSQFIKILKGIL